MGKQEGKDSRDKEKDSPSNANEPTAPKTSKQERPRIRLLKSVEEVTSGDRDQTVRACL